MVDLNIFLKKTIFHYRTPEKKMESNIMENNLKDQLKTMRKDLADKSQRLGKNYAQNKYLIYVFLIIKIELISNFLLWQVFDSPCFKFKLDKYYPMVYNPTT